MKHPSDGVSPERWDETPAAAIDCFPWDENGYKPKAEAKVFITADNTFHVRLRAYETAILAKGRNRNDFVHKDSCIEFFFNPAPEIDDRYINFEFNPIGTAYLSIGKDRYGRQFLFFIQYSPIFIWYNLIKDHQAEESGMKIILASASPRRQELFKLITDDFMMVSSDVEEITPFGLEPEKCPEFLAVKKAEEIARNYPDGLVVGCDTSVILDALILGKPTDHADARRMLLLLSGKTHHVVTGCCLFFNGQYDTFHVRTEVEFYSLSDEEIERYIETQEPFDKAGAYAIQGRGALLVKEIHGDYYNVMGLPVARLRREIQRVLRTLQASEKEFLL